MTICDVLLSRVAMVDYNFVFLLGRLMASAVLTLLDERSERMGLKKLEMKVFVVVETKAVVSFHFVVLFNFKRS